MSEPLASATRPDRHPWPRALVRLRRVWRDAVELGSFVGAVLAAVGRFATGRWPEPADQDYLAPKGRAGRRLTSRKAAAGPLALADRVSNGGSR